ncbi:hypothetical protein L3N51_00605 [Metallosphaera sp. J1]|uniref:DUF3211 domain-containing protein n=1 Tax=Metallosphaera javensis (ex Hofmann et al. 2022) TaxID=99938 RepID=UPI001EDE0C5A|nr:DUF3211 domain-containing protein [Metallosphaera javensis (ex Hofmann et al. 2022)]MCG3108324.1 hypothetical protein [Metallosphaera javensis (ex Hofmann et al. 2022)]
MDKSITVSTTHDRKSVSTILVNPSFVLPRLFPPIKEVTVEGNSFNAEGRFLTTKFHMHGSVIVKGEIIYGFYLSAGGGQGNGRLIIKVNEGQVDLRLEYEGKMEKLSGIFFMDRWFSDFASKLDEEIGKEKARKTL